MKALVATLALTLLAAPAAMAADLQCGVTATQQSGMLLLVPTVTSPTAMNASYKLHLTTSGSSSSNINQGGPFAAAAGQKAVLGQLGFNADASYKLEFTVTADGKTYDCSGLLN